MWTYRNIGILAACCVLLALGTFWFTLTQINVASAQANGFTAVSSSGATLNATLTFTNDGLFAVNLEHVTYTASLHGTELPLSEGNITGASLRTDGPTRVPISMQIAWQPSAQLAARMLAGGNTTITITGNAKVNAGPFSRSVPFETSVDAREYISQFIPQTQDELLGAVLGLFN